MRAAARAETPPGLQRPGGDCKDHAFPQLDSWIVPGRRATSQLVGESLLQGQLVPVVKHGPLPAIPEEHASSWFLFR